MPICNCVSFGCATLGGKAVSSYLLKKHINADFELNLKNTVTYEPINEWDVDVDLNLFHTHWSSKCEFDTNTTLLEYLFEVQRDFVFTPNAAKETVTTLLSTTKRRMIDIDERIPNTFTIAVIILKPFLSPLIRYHVCPNDCILFRKQYEDEVTCPFCERPRYELDGKTTRHGHARFRGF